MPRHDVTTWTGVVDIVAGCECGWGSRAKNALANAKRHATATGHVVNVLQQLSVTYAPRGMARDDMPMEHCFEAQDRA